MLTWPCEIEVVDTTGAAMRSPPAWFRRCCTSRCGEVTTMAQAGRVLRLLDQVFHTPAG